MKLFAELQTIESDYKDGTIEIVSGLSFSQYQTLRVIDFYSNSKYLLGNKYDNGKEKPFYNVVNTMVDTAVVATDIDTKDIVVEADNEESYDKSFLFNHEIQQWMKESDFAETLNEMGETRARYGGVVIKKCVETDGKDKGKMEVEVVDWKNLCTDPVSFKNGAKIEKHFLTPNDIRKKKDVWKNTTEAIDLYSKKGYTKVAERIEVWEAEGVFPVSYLEDEAEFDGNDKEDYSLQHHFFCVKGGKAVHLFWEELKESQYKYLEWKRVAGRALGRGVVEEGDESQVWTNDAIQKEQSAMELAGKILLKTNSKKIGNNVTTEYDNGSIITLEENKDINVINLLPPGILPEFQNLVEKWWSQYERATSSYSAVRGETPPSGQPYRLQALVSQAGSSHFDYRREEWGIFLKEVFYDWVFPYLQKKISKQHILASDFSPEELVKLDEAYAKYNANQFAISKMLNGLIVSPEEYAMTLQEYMQSIGRGGKRRFLDIPDGYYKDMEAKLSINITGEQKNKQAVMESLTNVLQTVAMNPMILQDPNMSMIFNKILETSGSGLSPISLSKGGMQQQQGMAQQQPQGPQGQPGQSQPSPLGQAGIQAVQPQAMQ